MDWDVGCSAWGGEAAPVLSCVRRTIFSFCNRREVFNDEKSMFIMLVTRILSRQVSASNLFYPLKESKSSVVEGNGRPRQRRGQGKGGK